MRLLDNERALIKKKILQDPLGSDDVIELIERVLSVHTEEAYIAGQARGAREVYEVLRPTLMLGQHWNFTVDPFRTQNMNTLYTQVSRP